MTVSEIFNNVLVAAVVVAGFLLFIGLTTKCMNEKHQARLKCLELGKSAAECEQLIRD